jgi:protein phosphatase
VRELNEDRFLMKPVSGIWAVADGMGGHEAGEVASTSIVEHLATIGIATSANDLRARFEDRLGRAHQEIRDIARARGVTIGSTVAALLAMNGSFACLWSGDSRVYLVRHGSITQVSRDHTEAQELLDRGVATARKRAMAAQECDPRAVGVSEDITMEFQYGETLPGDVFILCTDGLTAHVENAEFAPPSFRSRRLGRARR